jgi:hypothetical protein
MGIEKNPKSGQSHHNPKTETQEKTETQQPETQDKRGVGALTNPPAETQQGIVGDTVNDVTDNQKDLKPPFKHKGEDLTKWLTEDAWATPKWLKKGQKSTKMLDKNYDEYVKNQLRWQYMRLEGDFRTALSNFYDSPYCDRVIARRIISFLGTVKEALEGEECDTLDVSNLLNMIDQYMVWLYPPHVAQAQAKAMSDELLKKKHPLGESLKADLALDTATNLDSVRAALDRIKDTLNQESQSRQINDGLQIERLEMLVRWGRWILGIMIIGVPALFRNGGGSDKQNLAAKAQDIAAGAQDIAAKVQEIAAKAQDIGVKAQDIATTAAVKGKDLNVFNDTFLIQIFQGLQPWAVMLIIALIGAVGAFLSGLMQIRDTSVTIGEYKKSVVQFHLRPIVGAIFAIIMTTLLSWNLIAGLDITSAGVYILSAFLCGFSERYFLDILDLKGKETLNNAAQNTGIEVSSSVPISTASTPVAK